VEKTLQQEVDRLTEEHEELSRRIARVTGSSLPYPSSERSVLPSAVPDIIDVDILEEMPPLRSEILLPLTISEDLIRMIGTISLGSIEEPPISDLPTFSPEEMAEKVEEDEVRDDLAQAELDRMAALSLGPVPMKTMDIEDKEHISSSAGVSAGGFSQTAGGASVASTTPHEQPFPLQTDVSAGGFSQTAGGASAAVPLEEKEEKREESTPASASIVLVDLMDSTSEEEDVTMDGGEAERAGGSSRPAGARSPSPSASVASGASKRPPSPVPKKKAKRPKKGMARDLKMKWEEYRRVN